MLSVRPLILFIPILLILPRATSGKHRITLSAGVAVNRTLHKVD